MVFSQLSIALGPFYDEGKALIMLLFVCVLWLNGSSHLMAEWSLDLCSTPIFQLYFRFLNQELTLRPYGETSFL